MNGDETGAMVRIGEMMKLLLRSKSHSERQTTRASSKKDEFKAPRQAVDADVPRAHAFDTVPHPRLTRARICPVSREGGRSDAMGRSSQSLVLVCDYNSSLSAVSSPPSGPAPSPPSPPSGGGAPPASPYSLVMIGFEMSSTCDEENRMEITKWEEGNGAKIVEWESHEEDERGGGSSVCGVRSCVHE